MARRIIMAPVGLADIGDSGGDPGYHLDTVEYIPTFIVNKAKGEFSKSRTSLMCRVPHAPTTIYIE